MKRHAIIAALAVAMCITACRRHVPNTPMGVAEESYRALIEERWDDYVSVTANADSLPAHLRRERIDMVREYMEFERQMRGGLTSVRALRDTMVADGYAYVFLEVTWGADSLHEEVMLPMVQVAGKWRVR